MLGVGYSVWAGQGGAGWVLAAGGCWNGQAGGLGRRMGEGETVLLDLGMLWGSAGAVGRQLVVCLGWLVGIGW
ncbi:hypothetical protein CesoFtcFv8_001527 [Champsocephalus esox]|uniref:Uncharacterized protein n=1 Tax=Champsocephalus esox TaxID=159716 RepID=A0AAN8HI02_9TELE|nr:hypothetical protein CesoFtcFv8_001527 [Champsocephalus esox]